MEEGMATHSSILAWRIPMDRNSLHRIGGSEQNHPQEKEMQKRKVVV